MTADVVPFPGAVAAVEHSDPHGITRSGLVDTILSELPDSVPPMVAVGLTISPVTTEVKRGMVIIRWPDHPSRVLRVPLAVVRHNSRKAAS